MAAAHKVDCVVIGAGVVGLSIARTLALRGREVLILDKASHIGAETSSRNSEVIHSGIYYPRDSLKAQYCVQGKKLLYDFCQEREIPFRRCGKLVVATSKEQVQSTIQHLYRQAHQNGVSDVTILTRDQVKDLEPLVECAGALYSPSTGILDSHSLMLSFLVDAESMGATLALRSKVDGARIESDGFVSLHSDGVWITAKHVVNAGGLWADRIARLIHQRRDGTGTLCSEWLPPRQYFCKGSYFQLRGNIERPFQRLVYPIPDRRGGLGVHATVDITGQVKFGPDVEWLDMDIDPDDIDYTPDPSRLDFFYASIQEYYPSVFRDSLQVDYCGVRPKLSHPTLDSSASALLFQDFRIFTQKDHGVGNLVHLFGMESPGLTSAMAIAEYVCDELLQQSGGSMGHDRSNTTRSKPRLQ